MTPDQTTHLGDRTGDGRAYAWQPDDIQGNPADGMSAELVAQIEASAACRSFSAWGRMHWTAVEIEYAVATMGTMTHRALATLLNRSLFGVARKRAEIHNAMKDGTIGAKIAAARRRDAAARAADVVDEPPAPPAPAPAPVVDARPAPVRVYRAPAPPEVPLPLVPPHRGRRDRGPIFTMIGEGVW